MRTGPAGARPPCRVLLVADRCGIGDALRVRGLVEAACRSLPGATVTLLAGDAAAAALGRIQGLDRVVVSRLHVPRLGPLPRRKAVQALEVVRLLLRLGRRHDVAVVLQWGSTSLDLVARLAARRTYGYENALPGLLLSRRLGPYGPSDELGQNRHLLRLAGIDVGEVPDARDWDESDARAARDLLAVHGLAGARRLVVLHAGSDWACQEWQPERWAELATSLWQRNRADLVFTGLAGDAAHVERIRSLTPVPTVSLVGETPVLGSLSALLAMARLCVSVDSAVAELAQRAGVRTVVVAGPSPAEPVPGAPFAPVVVNRTPLPLRFEIGRCQQGKLAHRCHDWRCPMAGMNRVHVEHVRSAIDGIEALELLPAGC